MKKNVLIIDDDAEIRMAMNDFIKPLADEVTTAHDGPTAIKIVTEQAIAVAIIDLVMPNMGGVECLRKIKEISPATACIIMTGFEADRKTRTYCLSKGALSFMSKPPELSLLSKVIESGFDTYRTKQRSAEGAE